MTRKISNILTSIILTSAMVISTITMFPVTSNAEEYIEEEVMTTFNAMNVNLDNISTVNAFYVDSDSSKYDPRPYSRVTSVKNQGQEGMCWDYAVQACAESSLIMSGQATNSIDLSEIFYAYDRYKKITPAKTFYQFAYGGGSLVSQNLNDSANFHAFALESDFPMPTTTGSAGEVIPDTNKINTYTLTDNQLENYKYIVSRSYSINNYEPTTECITKIKQLISKFGGVTYDFYSDTSYMNNRSTDATKDISFYCPNKKDANHAVEIVGWDDNYSASNFKNTPPGNGAWLIKNSWGTGAEKQEQIGNYLYTYKSDSGSGFMWISYYNDSIGDNVCAMELVPKGTATYETKSLTHKADKAIDLTKINSDAKSWTCDFLNYSTQTLNGTDYTPTTFTTYTFKGYDDWGNLLGKYEIEVVPSQDAKLVIDVDDITENNSNPAGIPSIFLYNKVTIDGIRVEPIYTSSNENVAYVNKGGYLIFSGFGTTTIKGEVTINGTTYTDSFNVTVDKGEISYIGVSNTWYYVKVGESQVIEGVYTNPWNDEITYTSNDNSILTVDSNGNIRGISVGTTRVTVRPKSNQSISAEVEVTVWNDEATTTPAYTENIPVTPVTPTYTETPVTYTYPTYVAKKTVGKAKISKVSTGKKKITVKFSCKNATQYEIQIATNSKFTKGKKVYYGTKGSYTVKKLKSGKTYYVRVRGYSEDSVGNWSKVSKVKIKK